MELLPGDLCRNFTQSAFIVAGIAYGERCMADDFASAPAGLVEAAAEAIPFCTASRGICRPPEPLRTSSTVRAVRIFLRW